MSFGAASLIFGAAAFITHVFGLEQRPVHGLVLLALLISVLPNLRHGLGRLKAEGFPSSFGFYLGLLLLILLLQSVFPVYIGGFWYFDWWQHYNLSQMYMGKVPHDYLWLGIYNFASRTPLFNLNAAFFLSLLGDSFWLYQIAATILNTLFVFPSYFLCRRMAGERAAKAICALLFLAPSIIHNTWYPWPKLFASYFILLAAYLYLQFTDMECAHQPARKASAPHSDSRMRRKRFGDPVGGQPAVLRVWPESVLIFVLVWAGFLAHQSTLFSSAIILLYMFLRAVRVEPRKCIVLAIVCGVCFVVINGVWFGWATSFFGIKRSLLSYYERPATVGGLSGYLILFSYHTLATICSPLFLYDVFGGKFDSLVFLQNIQALYYNSAVGFATITVFCVAIILVGEDIVSRRRQVAYPSSGPARATLFSTVAAGLWYLMMAFLVFTWNAFGTRLFSHYFNHPAYARTMFGAYFFAGAVAALGTSILLWPVARGRPGAASGGSAGSGALLLFWMAMLGYAGGIATHHELYIHGMVSAGSATAVLLTVLFLGRVVSDLSGFKKALLAAPIFCESFLITWAPLFIIKFDHGWSTEKNWHLKDKHSLVFMADLFRDLWWLLAALGIGIQAAMVAMWTTGSKKETEKHD